MVSFSCEGCGDVLTKKKLDGHRNQCRGATFTCLDCMVHFWGTEYKAHTSCISEAQKYQGALYKPEKQKGKQNQNQNQQNKQQQQQQQQQPQKAYIEDVKENTVAVVSAPPEAPMPPSAVAEHVNVFDYMVGQETPNASTVNLLAKTEAPGALVRFETSDALVQTPAPKKAKKAKTPATAEPKSDKKRKRLHVDTSASSSVDRDLEMTDAPPVLHSGLTGGLQKMMSSDFPPTPDLSGDAGDKAEDTPVKRKKSKRHSSEGSMGLALMRMVTNTSTKKPVKKSKSADEERPRKHQKVKKAIEYNPSAGEEGQAVEVFRPKVEPDVLASMLLAFVDKSESENGISVSKALKRYHRLRAAEGGAGKAVEEKELWKALRMRKNEAGEIVLFF